MDYDKALESIPDFILETLTEEEHALLRRHLEDETTLSTQELDQLGEAASWLAETLEPVVPNPQLKKELFDRIESEPQHTAHVATLAPEAQVKHVGSPHSDRPKSYLPFVAASLLALAAGSLSANFASFVRNGGQMAELDRQLKAQWQRRVEEAAETFGPPRANLISFDSEVPQRRFGAAIFYDGVARQMHVLVTRIERPAEGQQAYLWLLDEAGEVLQGFPLEILVGNRAATVVDLPVLPKISGMVITNEPAGNPSEPQGPVLGRSTLRQTT